MADRVRYSQRQPLSCQECARRKQRCDKNIPCQNCIKRGKGDACRLEETVKRPAVAPNPSTSTPSSSKPKRLRNYATLSTVEHLNNKVMQLEQQLSSVVGHLGGGGAGGVAGSSTGPGTAAGLGSGSGMITTGVHIPSPLQHHHQLQGGGNGSSRSRGGQSASAGGSQQRRSSSGTAAMGGSEGDGNVGGDDDDDGDEDDSGEDETDPEGLDQEADAAATLEFLALGRSRAKSPGAEEDELTSPMQSSPDMVGVGSGGGGGSGKHTHRSPYRHVGFNLPGAGSGNQGMGNIDGNGLQLAQMQGLGGAPSFGPVAHRNLGPYSAQPQQPYQPSTHHASSHQSQPGLRFSQIQRNALPDPQALMKQQVISILPSEGLARHLVQYDVEYVSWLHCCYHGPTMLSDCEAFWRDGLSGDVELNWSWMALYIGILMSAILHMPSEHLRTLLGNVAVSSLLQDYFQACITCLHLADWMEKHSLFAVQCVAIIVSAANHLGKSDLYFTMLGAAIRVAQALNLNHLGSDPYTASPEADAELKISLSAKALISREVKKRTWWQLVIQDWFHAPFNRSNVISHHQFDTPPPLHCYDADLSLPAAVKRLSIDTPSIDSHIKQLLKVAIQVQNLYKHIPSRGSVPYSRIMEVDAELKAVLAKAPSWMQYNEETGLPNPLPSIPNLPPWLEWQRISYMISASHKMIVIHRPYLGRAFRDERYAHSRQVCVASAHRILVWFTSFAFEPFRKTWTCLAHSIAACLILLLDIMHGSGENGQIAASDSLPLVLTAIEVFRSVEKSSRIAERGIAMLMDLVDGYRRRVAGYVPPHPKLHRSGSSSANRSKDEMDRAMQVLQTSRQNADKHRKSFSQGATPPTKAIMESPQMQVTPPAFVQPPLQQIPRQPPGTIVSVPSQAVTEISSGTAPPPPAAPQSPFQWLMSNQDALGANTMGNGGDMAVPDFIENAGFYEWDLDFNWNTDATMLMDSAIP